MLKDIQQRLALAKDQGWDYGKDKWIEDIEKSLKIIEKRVLKDCECYEKLCEKLKILHLLK